MYCTLHFSVLNAVRRFGDPGGSGKQLTCQRHFSCLPSWGGIVLSIVDNCAARCVCVSTSGDDEGTADWRDWGVAHSINRRPVLAQCCDVPCLRHAPRHAPRTARRTAPGGPRQHFVIIILSKNRNQLLLDFGPPRPGQHPLQRPGRGRVLGHFEFTHKT